MREVKSLRVRVTGAAESADPNKAIERRRERMRCVVTVWDLIA